MTKLAQIWDIIRHDLDPAFIKSIAISTGWEYAALYESLTEDPNLTDPYRSEEFAKRRGLCAIKALCLAAREHRIPFNFRQLDCNGQSKLFVKAGRVVLIHEPILTLNDAPRTSDYKQDLASSHSLIWQRELDLGDQPQRIKDWSGCILAVLLHGASGPDFTRDHKSLGGLMLGVPDGSYSHWVMRADLHRVAMFGFENAPLPDITADGTPESENQTDQVRVTPKKKNTTKEAGA